MALALPSEAVEGAKRTIRGMRFNGTSSYGVIYNATLPSRFGSSEYSGYIIARRRGSHEGAAGYHFVWRQPSVSLPIRSFHSDVSATVTIGKDSTGTTTSPYALFALATDTSTHTIQFTAPDSLSGANINAWIDGAQVTAGSPSNGTTALVTSSAGDFHIGNRSEGDRTYNGDIVLIALWRTSLTAGSHARARALGPLAVPENLLLCVVEGKDIGPYQLPIVWSNVAAGDVYSVPLKGY